MRDIAIVVVLMAVTFVAVDLVQPITVSCVSHGEPNCERLPELLEAARAQRSFVPSAVIAALVGIVALFVLRRRNA